MDNRSERGKTHDELIVITKAHDLAREMTQRVRKLPRRWVAGWERNPNVFRPHAFPVGGPYAIAR